jgi:osmotically-inducible protein OsmY
MTGSGTVVSDRQIQQHVQDELRWTPDVDAAGIGVAVEDGAVSDWDYQRAAARRIAEHIGGVREIRNRITLSLRASADETASSVRRALRRNALLAGTDIHVAVTGTRVTLSGAVRTELARRQAISAAWGSPNVTAIEDRLTVTSDV